MLCKQVKLRNRRGAEIVCWLPEAGLRPHKSLLLKDSDDPHMIWDIIEIYPTSVERDDYRTDWGTSKLGEW